MSHSILASELHERISVPSNIGFATDISDDGQATTIIFDNLLVSVEPARPRALRDHTAIQTKVFTVHIPYSTDQQSVTMLMDLRGFVDARAGADVRLVACAGGTTKVVALSTDECNLAKLKGTSKDAIAAEHPSMQLGDFQDRVEFTVQTHAAKPVCQITLFLLVEDNTDTADSGGALLALDSLDLEIVGPGKGTCQL
jgi:hypothetical protein